MPPPFGYNKWFPDPADDFLNLPDNKTHSVFEFFLPRTVHVRAIRLSRPDAIGQTSLGCLGLVTSLIVVLLLTYLLAHGLYRGEGKRKERAQALRKFIQTDLGVYVLNLLVSDLFVPLSASANLRWGTKYIVHQSLLCDVQGAFNQLGLCSAAVFNVLLAAQTWSVLFLKRAPPPYLKWVLVPLGWAFALLMTCLGPALNKHPFSFYGPTSTGCWLALGPTDFVEWYTSMAALSIGVLITMAVIYVLLFLSLSGALKKMKSRLRSPNGRRLSTATEPDFHLADGSSLADEHTQVVRTVARRMLWFPASYGILSIPMVMCVLLIARLTPLPHIFYIACNSAFVCISLADVLIFLLTRRALLRPSPNPSTPTLLPASPFPSTHYLASIRNGRPVSHQHPQRTRLSTSTSVATAHTDTAPPFSRPSSSSFYSAVNIYSPKSTASSHFSYTTTTTTVIDPEPALVVEPLARVEVAPDEPVLIKKKKPAGGGGGGRGRSSTELSARGDGEEDGVGLVRIVVGRGGSKGLRMLERGRKDREG